MIGTVIMSTRQNEHTGKRQRKLWTVFLWIAALIFLKPDQGRSYDLYVTSLKASIYLMPDTTSEALFEVKQGFKLNGVRKSGYWHQVDHESRTGWIYGFQVGEKPPVKKNEIYGTFSSLFQKYETFMSRARRRSSAYSSVAAARGLKEHRQRVTVQYRLDFEALEKLEAVQFTDEQVMEFLREGMQNEKSL